MRIFLITLLIFLGELVYSQSETGIPGYCTRHSISPEQLTSSVSVPHAKRQRQFDVGFYFLDLNIENSTNAISGNVMLRVKALQNNFDTLALELINNLNIDSVKASLAGSAYQAAVATRNGAEVNVVLPFAASAGQTIETRIYYHGTPPVSGSFPTSGFFAGNGHKFSATPPYNAYTWFPCKQDLTDKADSSWFFITTSSSLKAVSNGYLSRIVNVPGNKKRWEWKSSYPIAYYLIAFVVGNYTENSFYWKPQGRTDSMLVSYYNYSNASQTPQILDVFSKLFGLYPFYKEKLAMAGVDLGGGIENQTIIGMGPGAPESHEIMHQWFGDNVTCASWKDIMLSEGFAEWGISVYDEFKSGSSNPAARISRCNTYESNALTNSGSVYGRNMDTSTVVGVFLAKNLYYDKGAMVINALRFEINNDEVFFQGLRNYQDAYRGSYASARELREIMEDASGLNLEDFFNQWYYGEGYPRFNIRWNNTLDSLFLQITQTTNAATNPLFKTSLELKVQRTQGDTIIRLFIDKNLSSFKLPVSGQVTGIVTDPNQWILNGTGTIAADNTLNTQNLENNPGYLIAPNPATNQIYLCSKETDPAMHLAELYTPAGQLVFRCAVRLNEAISLPSLTNGLYYLSLDKGRFSKLMLTN